MTTVPNIHIEALDAAYDAGYQAAFADDRPPNPYSYSMQKALYWEWERGYRDCLYGVGK